MFMQSLSIILLLVWILLTMCLIFGIIALHEVNPRVIVRFTLKNTRNNRKQTWTQLIAGETLDELFENVFEVIEANKVEVW